MYVEIHAKSGVAEEVGGLRLWINRRAAELQMELVAPSPGYLDSPAWHIEIKGKNWIDDAGAAHGRAPRLIEQTLQLQITPSDLSALLNFAMSKGLVTIPDKAGNAIAVSR
jgi:hypothetical protein